jgi:hypothetical protein
VHDEPLNRSLNENKVAAPDAVDVFTFFQRNEKSMYFGLKNMPVELLIYVVDVTTPIEELQWSNTRYAGKPDIGGRFFEIQYDTEHLRTGAAKRVTVAGFSMPNILKHGGVCVDQAYFAMTVGKSIGIPTAYAVARSGTVGHAWVGFLDPQARGWNFDAGRYEEYQVIRGNVLNPQTRQTIPDSDVSLLAESIQVKPAKRIAAVAITDMARWLSDRPGTFSAPSAPENVLKLRRKPRGNDNETVQGLLKRAIEANRAHTPAWDDLIALADQGRLSIRDKQVWADAVVRACGQKYPDFTFSVLQPMVSTIADVELQNRIWNDTFRMFQSRQDIAAGIRMQQAAMWERVGEVDKAGAAYEDVLNRFPNAGGWVMDALSEAEAKLISLDRAGDVPTLYERTWARIPAPTQMRSDLIQASNWHRVGTALAARLEVAGRPGEAREVRLKLDRGSKQN